MKRLLLTVGLLGLTTACGTKTVYVEATTTAPPATQYVPQAPSYSAASEYRFLDFIRSQIGPLFGTEDTAIELGYTVCDSLRGGAGMSDMEDAVSSSLEPELIAAIIISAIYNLCPDQIYKAEEAYGDNSGV